MSLEPRYRPHTDTNGVTHLEAELAESPYSWDRYPYLPVGSTPSLTDQVRALLEDEDPDTP